MRTELVTNLKRKATERLTRRLVILEGIAHGERAIKQEHVVSHSEAKKRLARWLS